VKIDTLSGSLREALGGFVTAVRTLTRIPCPGPEAGSMASALPWLPGVGLMVGLAVAGIQQLIMWASHGWAAGSAAVALVMGCWLTRGLHLDGLSDCADGFGGGKSREQTLAIMKDPRVGAFGVIALIGILLLKWTSMQRLSEGGHVWWIAVPFVLSRLSQSVLAVAMPYARTEGGTGAPFVREARPRHLAGAVALGLLASLMVPGSWSLRAYAFLIAASVTGIYGAYCRRRVGGVTGDILGANSELVETTVLVLGAVCFHS
jgi:adenosylcobinamide-GDP ribazoletransferase